jgi:hypothetical protein
LSNLAKTSADQEMAYSAMHSAFTIARTPKAQFELLLDLSMPGSAIRKVALDRFWRLSDHRVPQYRHFLEAAGSHDRAADLVKIVDRMPDARGTKLVFDEALRQAGQSRNLQALVDLMHKAPDVSQKLAAFDRALNMYTGQPDKALALAAHAITFLPALRVRALGVFEAQGQPRSIADIERFSDHSDKQVAAAATSALEAIKNRMSFDRLIARALSGPADSRLAAIDALGGAADMRAVKPLLEVVAGSGHEVVSRAVAALRNYSPPLVKFEARQMIRQNPELRGKLQPIVGSPSY